MAFFIVWLRRENKRNRKYGRKFSLWAHLFFILQIWENNKEENVLKDALYTNTLNLSCIFSFFLLSSLGSKVALLFFGQSCCQLSLFFFLGINIASFFCIFFIFIFTGCDFFGTCFLFKIFFLGDCSFLCGYLSL